MSLKRWIKNRKIKTAIKLCLFLTLASLPFISATQIVGLETFLDSFENHDHYLCIQNEGGIFGTKSSNNEYVIVQMSSHPEFAIQKNDHIIYITNDEEIVCAQVYYISSIGEIQRYHVINNENVGGYILENQVVGKVIKTVDDNIWNSISITIWEISINNLNIRALFAE